jgi:lipopolysaccharide/colanic/teichoic acid biosynthesis glycosyltransferase
MEGQIEQALRRGMDIGISGVALLLLAAPLCAIALVIALSSPGPVFFRQERVGKAGRAFLLLKFRTMYVNSTGPGVTAGNDLRITPAGRKLRQWKLDELPQLLNVLMGDMSLVGPRPEVPQYVRHYTAEQKRVLDYLPGITGPCQLVFRDEESVLTAPRNPEEFYIQALLPMKLAMDLHYMEQRRLSDDLRLLWLTFGAIAGRPQPLESLVLTRQDAV